MTNHPRRDRRKDAPPIANRMPVWLRDRAKGKRPSPEQVRKTRMFAGPTQDEMADLLHVSKRAYRAWETGETAMHPNTWLAMRCACHEYVMARQLEAEKIRSESTA